MSPVQNVTYVSSRTLEGCHAEAGSVGGLSFRFHAIQLNDYGWAVSSEGYDCETSGTIKKCTYIYYRVNQPLKNIMSVLHTILMRD